MTAHSRVGTLGWARVKNLYYLTFQWFEVEDGELVHFLFVLDT